MNTAPVATPTRAAAAPVSSITDTLTVYAVLGTVPARPDSTLADPSTVTAPCTARKSTARRRRHDTPWTATQLLMVRRVPMRAMNEEPGKERPERGPEVEVETRPGELRQADPGRAGDAVEVVEPEEPGRDRARDDPDERRPETKRPLRPERDTEGHEHGEEGAEGGGGSEAGLRRPAEKIEHDRHDGDRNQHDHDSRDGRGDDPPDEGEPPGKRERDERGDEDQGREHRRTALGEGRDAYRDGRARAPHHQHVPGPEAAEPERLHDGGRAGDRDGGGHRPVEVGLGLARRAHHDGRDQHDAGDGEDRELKPEAEGERGRGAFVGLETDPGAARGVVVPTLMPAPVRGRGGA